MTEVEIRVNGVDQAKAKALEQAVVFAAAMVSAATGQYSQYVNSGQAAAVVDIARTFERYLREPG